MEFIKALEQMLKGKKCKMINGVKKNHIIGINKEGILWCYTCDLKKAINKDMLNEDWRVEK